MECNPFRSDSRNRQCSFWCDLLASRSNASWQQNSIRMCSTEFRKFSWFVLSLSGGNIEVVPCRPFRKGVFIFRVLAGKKSSLVNNVLYSAKRTPSSRLHGSQSVSNLPILWPFFPCLFIPRARLSFQFVF